MTKANLLLALDIEEKAREITRCIKTHNPGAECPKPVDPSTIRQNTANLMVMCSQLRLAIIV